MTQTGYFIGSGGAVLELDIPAEGTMARERLDYQLERGLLTPIPEEEVERVVVDTDRRMVEGIAQTFETTLLRRKAPDTTPKASAKRGPAKAEPAAEAPAED